MSNNKEYPIFLDNVSTDEYLSICRSARERNNGEYFEEHMIIPMDFLRFVNGGVPPEKREYCKLTPEEHWKCHELLVNMFPAGGKQWCMAKHLLSRIKEVHLDAKNKTEYGFKQRQKNFDWKNMTEIQKYH